MRQLSVGGTWNVRADEGDGRTVDALIVPWDAIGETDDGPELVRRGAFSDVDPARVVLRMDHADPPAGRATALDDQDDGAVARFAVGRTPRGDELLATVAAGLEPNVSIGFREVPGGSRQERVDGRSVRVHSRIDLVEVSTTWRPVYAGATVLSVRSDQHEAAAMDESPDTIEQAGPAAPIAPTGPAAISGDVLTRHEAVLDRLMGRLDDMELRQRQDLTRAPGDQAIQARAMVHRGQWASVAVRALAGERIPDLELRALADVTTTTNLGVVPPNFRSELIGIIDPSRPFLDSTKQVPPGDSGMRQTMPRIVQRPLTGKQATEKAEVASRATIIDSVNFDAVTIAGAGDLSIQVIRRSSPQYLATWLDLLAESYAINADNEAVDALLAASPIAGGVFNPASPSFGAAYTNAAAVHQTLRPDRIWLSTAAVAAFIDAKEPTGGGGRPLYPGLVSIASVAGEGSPGGPAPISLRPVHVPALDDEAPDLIVGPSAGFAWAEDGTYQLSADVPAKAGRDVGLVGMIWFMPIYGGAFTTYTLA